MLPSSGWRGFGGTMGLSCGLLVCFLLWGAMVLCSPHALWKGWARRSLLSVQSVVVECLEAQLVVTVRRDMFGTGKLVRPADLTLGPQNCEPLVSLDTDDVIRFEVGLHECGSSVQVTHDALLYHTFLLHDPHPLGNLSILRTNRAKVPIECRYPRQGNVSSQAILPTWLPFRTTVISEEKLAFSLHLMEEDWNAEKKSSTFQLGDVAHLQAHVHTGRHVPLRLFVDHCVATMTPDRRASPSHTIVDFHGCLVDGLSEAASSTFKAPRSRPETLRFTVDMFHFANDSRNTIYITCHLKVAPANQNPDQLNKACSFSKSSKSWTPVEGTADICQCCKIGVCPFTRAVWRQSPPAGLWHKSAPRHRRHVTEEADVTVGPLIFLKKAGDRGVQESTSLASVALGVGLATAGSLTLATIVLGLSRKHHPASHPVTCPVSALQ